ncbi:hypothetical protein GCM10027449_18500 [Sinomonas notoginsengisoli]|uniref:helix-turn-helix domain-containing protein n=1 Tax=Sinomonas notoginsengisoli TaxID=1457311 RepID=UPI0035561002
MTADKPTLIEQRQSSNSGRLGIAAARLAVQAAHLLSSAFAARRDIDQKSLAELIGVSEGRVSQVLHGDGNVHVATLARYLAALGYEIEITAKPVEPSAQPLESPRRSSRGVRRRDEQAFRQALHQYKVKVARGWDVRDETLLVAGHSGTHAPVFLEAPVRVSVGTLQELSQPSRAAEDMRLRTPEVSGTL